MQLSRRYFSRNFLLTLTVLTGVPLTMTGCGIFSDILSWTAVAGTALDGIVTVLGSLVPPTGLVIVQAIKAFLMDLANAVTTYQNDANPADKATLLARIRTLLLDIGANFQSFFQQITAGSPIVAIALGLAQVVLAAIQGFLGQLHTAAGTTPSLTLTLRSNAGQSITVTPKYYKSVGEFKRDFNAVCMKNNHPELEIK